MSGTTLVTTARPAAASPPADSAYARSAAAPPSGEPRAFTADSTVVRMARSPEHAALEQRMIALVNRDRAEHGLPPLEPDPALTPIALAHSRDMVEHDFFAHHSPQTGSMSDRYAAAGYLAVGAAENLAINGSIAGAQVALMNSPGHRANLLNADMTHIGIGIVVTGSAQRPRYTITQNFSRPYQALPPTDWADRAANAIREARANAGQPALAPDPRLNRIAAAAAEQAARQGYDGEQLKQLVRQGLQEAGIDYRRFSFQYLAMYQPEHLQVPEAVAAATTTGIGFGVATAPPGDDSQLPQTVLLTLTLADR